MHAPVPTARTAHLLGGCAALALGGFFVPELTYAAVAASMAVAAAALADWLMAADPALAEWRRTCPETAPAGSDIEVTLSARWAGRKATTAYVRDDIPDRWHAVTRPARIELLPARTSRVRYHVRVRRRGDATFPGLSMRTVGPLGLVMRQLEVPLESTCRAMPDYRAAGRYDLLSISGKLQHTGIRPVQVRGRGTEFESLRLYQPDDDYRSVNWKATARRGEPVTADYQVERSQSILVALDAGRLMAAEVEGRAKLDWAMDSALLVAHVAERGGDRAGVCVFSDAVQVYLPPKGGRDQVSRISAAIYNVEPSPQDADYAGAFAYLRSRGLTRSLIVCLSDVTEEGSAGDLPRQMAALSPKHVPCLILLGEPEIADLAHAMPKDADGALEKAAAAQVLADRGRALRAVTQAGGLAMDVAPQQSGVSAINAYLEVKRGGRL